MDRVIYCFIHYFNLFHLDIVNAIKAKKKNFEIVNVFKN